MPLAIGGRGPRVERLAAERADWILLAGRALERVPYLVADLRATGTAARGRPPSIAWNPSVAWTDAMVDEIRSHLAYMAVDMPPAERAALGADELMARYAITGPRDHVVARLSELRRAVQPELLLFEMADYSVAYLESVARVALDAGVVASHNGAQAD
jgi:alkanesulfonate monooxygenase SsuD/methylene tetrahydromethanopterin reductase-like flavin-dependent oxidoreductase (luciferase family)